MRKLLCYLLTLTLVAQFILVSVSADTRPALEDRGAMGLALALRRLQTIGSVLHTGAHPDDESSDLLAYLARGIGARTAYLSLTRGDGGQNGIGPELWEGLGVLRTEELLAARKLDGAEQYFTRAFDFGFTRSAEETLKKWNREEVLGDMVRVIRMMRPLVVVNGFSGTTGDGHGQHQVAGMLTPEAIKAAADPARFPEQIKEGLQPWQVIKVYSRRFGGGGQGAAASFDTGQYDPVLGRSTAEIASEGRSKHRSQDQGGIQGRGSRPSSLGRLESLVSAPDKESSVFDGMDVSITGVAKFAGKDGERLMPSLTKIKDLAARAMNEYRAEHPEAIAPHLAAGLREVRAVRGQLNGLDTLSRTNVDALLAYKEKQFEDVLVRAHGIVVDALSSTEIVTPGESLEVTTNVYEASGVTNPRPEESRYRALLILVAPKSWRVEPLDADAAQPSSNQPQFGRGGRERANDSARFRVTVPADEPPSQPYWLAKERTREQFDWDASMPQGLPFAPPRLTAQVELTLNGESVKITQPVEYRFADKSIGEMRHELKIAPPLTVTVHPRLLVIPKESKERTREVSVEVLHNAHSATQGAVKLLLPPGWRIEADSRPLAFTRQGERATRIFRVTPPANASGNFDLKAVAETGGHEYTSGYTSIAYSHVETRFVYHAAVSKAESFDVKVAPGLKVGYVMGSGDDVPEALTQLGVNVKQLTESDLVSGDLSVYDTIILGIRVYEVRDDVVANNKRLLDYVNNGGTLIVQYNKIDLGRNKFTPFTATMSNGARVTDEEAPVTILAPDHPLFNFPNKITANDWQGWVQERGLYYFDSWDAAYTPLLSSADAGSPQLKGGELIAQVGKGHYIFTAYAWFRQLPAGVPGAYRLFANMISLPKAK